MNEKTAKATELEASADSDEAALAMYGFSDLPVTFAMRDGQNVIQETAPCYLCAADGFYGNGTSGTWFEEGSIIVYDSTPNAHLMPLNRAGAVRWVKWAAHLASINRVAFDIGDMAEAAQMLAKNPKVQELDPINYQKALIKLCEEIKIRREGRDARTLPGMSPHNFAPQSGGNAPPMLGAKQAAMTERGPGMLHGNAGGSANAGKGGVRRAAGPGPVANGGLGGTPPTP